MNETEIHQALQDIVNRWGLPPDSNPGTRPIRRGTGELNEAAR
jgi:hypothetical protein